jgi:hypothetical protein
MTNTIHAMITSPYADNHLLYSLLFFLHFIYPDLEHIDVDAPISQFDEDSLLIAGTFMELHQGIDIPDAMLADKTKTLRQMADEIRLLPKLTDELFQKKLLLDIASWRSILDMN